MCFPLASERAAPNTEAHLSDVHTYQLMSSMLVARMPTPHQDGCITKVRCADEACCATRPDEAGKAMPMLPPSTQRAHCLRLLGIGNSDGDRFFDPFWHPLHCGGIADGGRDHVASGANLGQQGFNVHLELRFLHKLLHCDGGGGCEDVVEGPVKPQPRRGVQREPPNHQRKQSQGKRSRLRLLTVVQGFKGAEKGEGDSLSNNQDDWNSQVAQGIVPPERRRVVDPPLSQPAQALSPIRNRTRQVGDPEETLVINLCLGNGRNRVVDTEEDRDLCKRRQAASERIDVDLLKEVG
mmetsp:Transcript_3243/g.9967  ORF Transcript_3243/g.9967 Transcript_3243/m.9967 type:complete len:295 (+) Transcript_3243:296-1180(+)|eukprot:scaffold226342_cov33-Tisochrysis_lutea.AAC.2